MVIDYHLHNHFSADSESDTTEIVKQALKRGIQEICITNHVEHFSKGGGNETFSYNEAMQRFTAVKKEIEEVQKKFPDIPIRFGAELEYVAPWMPEMKRFIHDMDFDFLIGSVHIVENVVISSHHFAHDLYSAVPEKEAYTKYFEGLHAMVEWGQFDVVGHFDINKKYGHQFYGPARPQKYKDQIMAILQLMQSKGIGIELNTACLHDKCHELFPHPDILKWCLEVGIEHYTLGSDAHEIERVGENIKEALQIAKDIGIPAITTYQKRQPAKHRI